MESLRRVICGWEDCHSGFLLCRRCDHGDRYCSRKCRQEARRRSLSAGRLRHQRSEDGRLDHRDRNRVYRERRRRRVMEHRSEVAPKTCNLRVRRAEAPPVDAEHTHAPTAVDDFAVREFDTACGEGSERDNATDGAFAAAAMARPGAPSVARWPRQLRLAARCDRCARHGTVIRHETLSGLAARLRRGQLPSPDNWKPSP
jgi:hypothetical protein